MASHGDAEATENNHTREDETMKPMTYEGMSKLDGGRLALAVDRAIERVTADMDDRPGLKTARTVTLTLRFAPVADDKGDTLVNVGMAFDVKTGTPPRRSRAYVLGLAKKRGAKPGEAPVQMVFSGLDEEGREDEDDKRQGDLVSEQDRERAAQALADVAGGPVPVQMTRRSAAGA